MRGSGASAAQGERTINQRISRGGNRVNTGVAVNQTENPGRVTDRGLLCWAVLGERGGGPPSRIVRGYDQIAGHSARDLSQRSAQVDAGCLWVSTMLELHP
jgi:hypothetical protein